jgi:hypothetical protein
MNRDYINRYVGVYPADGGELIGWCVVVLHQDVSLESQIQRSIDKLELSPGDYVAISQIGTGAGPKTLTNFTIRVAAAPLEVVL